MFLNNNKTNLLILCWIVFNNDFQKLFFGNYSKKTLPNTPFGSTKPTHGQVLRHEQDTTSTGKYSVQNYFSFIVQIIHPLYFRYASHQKPSNFVRYQFFIKPTENKVHRSNGGDGVEPARAHAPLFYRRSTMWNWNRNHLTDSLFGIKSFHSWLWQESAMVYHIAVAVPISMAKPSIFRSQQSMASDLSPDSTIYRPDGNSRRRDLVFVVNPRGFFLLFWEHLYWLFIIFFVLFGCWENEKKIKNEIWVLRLLLLWCSKFWNLSRMVVLMRNFVLWIMGLEVLWLLFYIFLGTKRSVSGNMVLIYWLSGNSLPLNFLICSVLLPRKIMKMRRYWCLKF